MRSRFFVVSLMMLLFLWSVYLVAGADEGELVFISKCGQCHKTGGSAPIFAPNKYAGKQWGRFFARNKHKRKKDITGVISPEELEKVKKYLVDHAADSSQPEAAGLK